MGMVFINQNLGAECVHWYWGMSLLLGPFHEHNKEIGIHTIQIHNTNIKEGKEEYLISLLSFNDNLGFHYH